MKILKHAFSRKSPVRFNHILYVSFKVRGNVLLHDAGHSTKIAAMPTYDKNSSKSSSLEPAGRFPRNLV